MDDVGAPGERCFEDSRFPCQYQHGSLIDCNILFGLSTTRALGYNKIYDTWILSDFASYEPGQPELLMSAFVSTSRLKTDIINYS